MATTSKENNDCYFYYYSACNRGAQCLFRHEPSALGCETMCPLWKQGHCPNVKCSYRHMELKKNRKAIACYWESQPIGCQKPHCPFQHTLPRNFNQADKVAVATTNAGAGQKAPWTNTSQAEPPILQIVNTQVPQPLFFFN